MDSQPIVFIVGPTAVGKTDVGFLLARQLQGEIVSCDAMQVYREVTIATSKPPLSMRQQVPHHLIDLVSVTEEFDVARFNRGALQALDGIRRRGKMPIVVGGSGMYMQVLLDGIFSQNTPDPELRGELQARITREGNAKLYAELERIDPEAAAKIHENDSRRIIRALEVYYVTRRPISALQKERHGLWGREKILLFALTRPRSELYERINQRVETMFQEGIVEEIAALAALKLSRTAAAIIGVAEIRGYLAGTKLLAEAQEEMKLNTRHLAKRQMTWFRKEKRLAWEELSGDISPEQVAQRILEKIERT